jgi:hypothetical protein
MQKYLFLILDRYEASLSESHELKAGLSDPKTVFRNCMIGIVGRFINEVEEWYDDEIADQVCQKGNFTTYDDEEQSFLLIKLEN